MQAKTIKAGLFGRPLSKSLSPQVFGVFSELTGNNISYELRECSTEGLTAAIAAARADGWTGFNATIPHKRAVLEMLDSADQAARETGAANTVRFGDKGAEGTNTDAHALSSALKERGISVSGLSAAVYGAGGAAAAVAWALAGAGAAHIDICARKPEASQTLKSRLSKFFPAASFGAPPFGEPPAGDLILVNATPIGMYSHGTPPCAPRRENICIDLAYAAGGTDFTRSAKAAGALTLDGLDLLVWQAALALDFWGGFAGGDIVKFKNDASELLARQTARGPLMLRYLTAGESHGKYLAGILEGFPAGITMTRAYIAAQLERRRLAPGRSARQTREKDDFEIISGMSGSVTTGAPIAVLIKNVSRDLPPFSSLPRPGHADLAGMLKYGTLNAALIRERASARETAMRVALGSFALRLNELLGIRTVSRVVSLGNLGPVTPTAAAAEILRARRAGDTLGGEFEVVLGNVPAGLGGFSQADRRLGARLAAALLGINGVKGFEIGGGFALAAAGGMEASRDPELSGGLDGGMTNGLDLLLRCAVKPVPGLPGGAMATDLRSLRRKLSVSKTSDTTAVFAAAVVGEHAAALELADAVLEKFGGDSLEELLPRVKQWRAKTAKIISRR